jgi:hypothetical protein
MTQLQKVKIDGTLQTVNYNFAALAPIETNIGIGNLRVARFVFDTDDIDSDGDENIDVGAHGVGVSIPANAIVMGGFFDVNEPFGSAADTSTIAISVEGANDIQTAAAVSGAPYSTIGRKAIVPKINTPESTSVKTTVEREITCTVAVQALELGKLTGYLIYVEGELSADVSE